MKWCADVGGVGDGSVASSVKYVKTLGIEALSVGWANIPSFKESGSIDLATVKAMKDEIVAAGVEWGSDGGMGADRSPDGREGGQALCGAP